MMSGVESGVMIATSDAAHNLITGLLCELPLSVPTYGSTRNQSLLSHLKDNILSEDVSKLLAAQDSTLIPQLKHALDFATVENIELKNEHSRSELKVEETSSFNQVLFADNYKTFIGLVFESVRKTKNDYANQKQECFMPVLSLQPSIDLPTLSSSHSQDSTSSFCSLVAPTLQDGKNLSSLHNNTGMESTDLLKALPSSDSIDNSVELESYPRVMLHRLTKEEIASIQLKLAIFQHSNPKINAEENVTATCFPESELTVQPLRALETQSDKVDRTEGKLEVKRKTEYAFKPTEGNTKPIENSSKSIFKMKKETKPVIVLLSKLNLDDLPPEVRQKPNSSQNLNRLHVAKDKMPQTIFNDLSSVPVNKFASTSGYQKIKRRHTMSEDSTALSNPEKAMIEEPYCEALSTDSTTITENFKRKTFKKKLANESFLVENFIDSDAYQNFSHTVDCILKENDFDVDRDTECSSEFFIPLEILQKLSTETAKLKKMHLMNKYSLEKLVRLLAILEQNIIGEDKLALLSVISEEDIDEEHMERVMSCASASLSALYIMTSPEMPNRIFLENVIEKIVLFLKNLLQNAIFPAFDLAYRHDLNPKDGYVGNIKQKRMQNRKVTEKSFIHLYNKTHEGIHLLSELLELQLLNDSIILQVSTLSVRPFFVEGINELQLNALHLATTVFAKYENQRRFILEDILMSIARLPTSKKNLRNYRLNSGENIQMFTALILQLIQCVIRFPKRETDIELKFQLLDRKLKQREKKGNKQLPDEICTGVINSYETSGKAAISFLSVFLKKCGTKHEEMDYRLLFENFIQDLLITLNKPEWPASELLLSVLGRILVQNFSNKSTEITFRVQSLDYLGVIAARLRKDIVSSSDLRVKISHIIQNILANHDDDDFMASKNKKSKNFDEVQFLQKILLQYLDYSAGNDRTYQDSFRFYVAHLYYNTAVEVTRSIKPLNLVTEESIHSISEKGEKELKLEGNESNACDVVFARERKEFLLDIINGKEISKIKLKDKHIDHKTAELISQYLASMRHFSKSFDAYLTQILRVLNESSIVLRSKAMKCLTLVVEADPSILTLPDMQKSVHGRLLDHSTSVREATVDLLGKYVLTCPELISQYYEMLTARILDTGISVRKKVIKILSDICLKHPDFPQTAEIFVKIMRRINDDGDGIRKLVNEVFQSLWFSASAGENSNTTLRKVKNMTLIVEACNEDELKLFEQLIKNLFKNEEDGNQKGIVSFSKQIINCLVENLLQIEESSQNNKSDSNRHILICLKTLYLFCKIHPAFVVPYATTIVPYLSMRCNSQTDILLLKSVLQILELTVPLIEHPSESFLVQLEEVLVKLILQEHITLLSNCISCLSTIVNKLTKNYQLIKDCCGKFITIIFACKKKCEANSENDILKTLKPKLLRSLYTVGLFYWHCDFESMDLEQSFQISLKLRIFESFMYFNFYDDKDIKIKALSGLGFMMIRHHEFMLGPEVKNLYNCFLTSPSASPLFKCQVLKNITNYLVEEEMRITQKDSEWNKTSKNENLKEMDDVQAGMASTIVQVYLKQILDCVLHSDRSVRRESLLVIQHVFGQGLVHPVQIVQYLICLSSDDNFVIQSKAEQLLKEIEKKYPGFIQMKAVFGVRMSYKMLQLIVPNDIVRGFRCGEIPLSRNGFLYSVIRSNRQSRRAFLLSLLHLFEEQAHTPLTELLYVADNITYFPYVVLDEPLFIIYHIDLMLSISGLNILQTFREALLEKQTVKANEQSSVTIGTGENDDDSDGNDNDDNDFETLLQRLPENTELLEECIISAQACTLLFCIRQTLKETYNLVENKMRQYSPSESVKVYEKPLNLKDHTLFNPEHVLNFIQCQKSEDKLHGQDKEKLISEYLHFKQLMMEIDSSNEDTEEDGELGSASNVTPLSHTKKVNDPNENSETELTPVNAVKTNNLKPKKCKSSRNRSRKKLSNTPKSKVIKKSRKRKRAYLESDDSDSDPDFVCDP